MWFETAHTLDHTIRNRTSGATGLIQFMPSTAKRLGTSCRALAEMSNVDQLNYVIKYFLAYENHKYQDFVDLYCAIFWPAAVGKLDSYIITSDQVALQNPLFDLNKDKDITKGEIRQALFKQIPVKYINQIVPTGRESI
jgi:hypothetical protein